MAFSALALLGLAADLGTKQLMFGWSRLQPPGAIYWVVPEYAGFQVSLNEGALFGLGQGKQFWFAAFSVAAAIGIPVWLFVYNAAVDWWLTLPLGGVMGGVLGNLYDRVGLPGLQWQWPPERAGEPVYAVRDWILLQYDDAWRWPNFNLADTLLVVGAATLFFRTVLTPADHTRSPAADASATTIRDKSVTGADAVDHR